MACYATGHWGHSSSGDSGPRVSFWYFLWVKYQAITIPGSHKSGFLATNQMRSEISAKLAEIFGWIFSRSHPQLPLLKPAPGYEFWDWTSNQLWNLHHVSNISQCGALRDRPVSHPCPQCREHENSCFFDDCRIQWCVRSTVSARPLLSHFEKDFNMCCLTTTSTTFFFICVGMLVGRLVLKLSVHLWKSSRETKVMAEQSAVLLAAWNSWDWAIHFVAHRPRCSCVGHLLRSKIYLIERFTNINLHRPVPEMMYPKVSAKLAETFILRTSVGWFRWQWRASYTR